MKGLLDFLRNLWRDENGNYVENIMWITLISLAVGGVLIGLGGTMKNKVNAINNQMNSVN